MTNKVTQMAARLGYLLAATLLLGAGGYSYAEGENVPSSLGASNSVSVPSSLGASGASDQSSSQNNTTASDNSSSNTTQSADQQSNQNQPPKKQPPQPGNWQVPNVAGSPSPLDGALPNKSFASQVRSAANKLVENITGNNVPQLPNVPGRPSIRPGDTSNSVTLLANHLTMLGLYSGDVESNQYTGKLVDAVKQFQKEHGLVADGIVGPQVAAALNVNPIHEADALRLWASAIDQATKGAYSAGAKYLVLVNIPSYTLHVIRVSDGVQVLESKVIVGAQNHQTPIFWTRIINLKVSPDWVAPQSMSKKWLRIPPGPDSPLGLMRFSTNNAQDIFLHDTDHRWLFSRSWRAISHGCVRVQHWPELAEVVGGLTPQRLQTALDRKVTFYLPVHGRILVRTQYSLTDLVNGHAMVLPDVYNRGNKAIGALSLQGQDEADPTTRFASGPNQPLGSDDRVTDQVGAP